MLLFKLFGNRKNLLSLQLQFILSADAKKAVDSLRFNKLHGRQMEVLEVTWLGENAPPGIGKQ